MCLKTSTRAHGHGTSSGDLNLGELTNYLSVSLLSWTNKLLPLFSKIMEKSLQTEHLLLIKHMQRDFSRYPLIKLKLSFTSFLISQLPQRSTFVPIYPWLKRYRATMSLRKDLKTLKTLFSHIFPSLVKFILV